MNTSPSFPLWKRKIFLSVESCPLFGVLIAIILRGHCIDARDNMPQPCATYTSAEFNIFEMFNIYLVTYLFVFFNPIFSTNRKSDRQSVA